MRSCRRKALVAGVFLGVLLSLSGCVQGGDSLDEGDFTRNLLFFEQRVRVEGEEGPPYVFLDFPTYRFDDREKMLVSFLGVFGDGEGKINPMVSNLIVGEGTTLSGSAGSGAASCLREATDFPFTTDYELLTISDMRDDGTLLLEPLNDTLSLFAFTFPSPLPRRTIALKPGERLQYEVQKTTFFAGRWQKLTLRVTLRSVFLERTHCVNGTWGASRKLLPQQAKDGEKLRSLLVV